MVVFGAYPVVVRLEAFRGEGEVPFHTLPPQRLEVWRCGAGSGRLRHAAGPGRLTFCPVDALGEGKDRRPHLKGNRAVVESRA